MNKLENKITARNRVNAAAKLYAPKIREALFSFVGQKIILASGGFAHRFAKAVAALGLPSDSRTHIYISSGAGYALTVNIRVTVIDDGCAYGEVTVYLFDLKNGVLVQNDHYATHADALRVDYTAAGIVAARERVKWARTVLQEAEMALSGFGEYDN